MMVTGMCMEYVPAECMGKDSGSIRLIMHHMLKDNLGYMRPDDLMDTFEIKAKKLHFHWKIIVLSCVSSEIMYNISTPSSSENGMI